MNDTREEYLASYTNIFSLICSVASVVLRSGDKCIFVYPPDAAVVQVNRVR